LPILTLKIDVDTYRGTREGVPNLSRLLQRHNAPATFLFTLGPDHTGRALRRVFRPGFFKKVSRTSVVELYGLKTLMYGVILPGPDIGKLCSDEMRAVRKAGFECGIHTWDHTLWQDNVRQRDAAWTEKLMQRAFDRCLEVFGEAPPTHGAAGWQMNPHAFRKLDSLGIQYASDGRAMLNDDGSLHDSSAGPHRLQIDGEILSCVQLPTTLPTLDEMLGRTIDGEIVTPFNIADKILRCTEIPRDHVYTLHPELEGQKFAPIFDKLLGGWKAQGYQFGSMADYYRNVKHETLPVHTLRWGQLPGRSGELIV